MLKKSLVYRIHVHTTEQSTSKIREYPLQAKNIIKRN